MAKPVLPHPHHLNLPLPCRTWCATKPWKEKPLMGRVWGEEPWERPGDQKEPEGWPLSTASRKGM